MDKTFVIGYPIPKVVKACDELAEVNLGKRAVVVVGGVLAVRGHEITDGDEVLFVGDWWERTDIKLIRDALLESGWEGDLLNDPLHPIRSLVAVRIWDDIDRPPVINPTARNEELLLAIKQTQALLGLNKKSENDQIFSNQELAEADDAVRKQDAAFGRWVVGFREEFDRKPSAGEVREWFENYIPEED